MPEEPENLVSAAELYPVSDDQDTPLVWSLVFRRSRIANGGWEWYFALGKHRLYPSGHNVGYFSGPDERVEDAFRAVMRQWRAQS
jgi:hypothetical protein